MKEILYIKNKELFGYRKISAIKDVGFAWGSGELNEEVFGILKIAITDAKVRDWENENKYCVSNDEKSIIETPTDFKRVEKVLEEEKE
jgi:hypothetical protein